MFLKENRIVQYRELTQSQLEIWLNDPVTKTYLQCLWWSQDQVKEVMGSGLLVDRSSMENTYGQIREAEGQKTGLSQAMDIVGQLRRHKMIEEDADIESPSCENIIND